MSLLPSHEYSAFHIFKAQWLYKMKANFGVFAGILSLQLLLLVPQPNRNYSSRSPLNMEAVVASYGSDTVLGCTMLFVGVFSFLMTMKKFRYRDFTFVTTRLSSNLSTIGFLLTLCAFGGLSASLSSMPVRLLAYFIKAPSSLSASGFTVPPLDWLTGAAAAVLYCLLASGAGFLIGSLFQNPPALLLFFCLAVLLPASVYWLSPALSLFAAASSFLDRHLPGFFSGEKSLWLFAVKTLAASAILYAGGILLTGRLEVKR